MTSSSVGSDLRAALRLTQSPNWRQRAAAARALVGFDSPLTRLRLVQLATNDDEVSDVIEAAAESVLRLGPSGVEDFLRAWDEVDDTLGGWMLNAVREMIFNNEPIDEMLAERQEHAEDPLIRRLAQYLREGAGLLPFQWNSDDA